MNTTTTARPVATSVRADVAVVVCLALALLGASLWGGTISADRRMRLHAAPFYGYWSWDANWWLAVVVALAVCVVRYGPRLADELPWRRLLAASFVTCVAFAFALALTDGWAGITRGLSSRHDYLALVELVSGPGEFVRTFLDRVATYPTHVRGHPPGLIAVLWWLGRFGLDGIASASVVMIVVGASAVPAVLVAMRAVAGEEHARVAAPFLVLAPALVWVATSADAVYLAVGAWSTALILLAATMPRPGADVLALAGGVVFGGGLLLSYGLALVGFVAVAVCISLRRWRVLVLAAGAGLIVVLAFRAMLGFWWLAGLTATRAEYARGVAAIRPYSYFVLANLVVFAVIVGPAAVRGLLRVHGGLVPTCCGALAAVALADLTGLSKGETERIWLPFWPWVGVAAAALPSDRRRWWLAVQAAVAVGVELTLYTHW